MSEEVQEPSKKPSNNAFKQQRLKAWQPLLTPKVVLPTFFLIGVIFIPLGAGLYITSQSVQEIIMEYTNCQQATAEFTSEGVPPNVNRWKFSDSVCSLEFNITEDFPGPVFLYYRLSNFYQNHRRYVKSFSSGQLLGTALPYPQLTDDCSPLAGPSDQSTATQVYYPCGLVANSLFNDTFSNISNSDGTVFEFSEQGIAWAGDRMRYKISDYKGNLTGGQSYILPPPYWTNYSGGYTAENFPDLSQNEHFQVWMRTSGLPTFRKLYGHSNAALLSGTWTIDIVSLYDVASFGGTKSVVISTTSWMGGKNPFLGIAYLVVGSICIALGIAFLIRHLVAPRKLGDHSYIKWKQG